ncbi:PilW family protein [Acinetobacter sp. YH12136]|uniref:PilW family protein n=1 Tax=Acinetobacter sp. YH12136 TaxID=2601120 RepID=UPI0015D420BD|nr:PilW family protein [Acinetobacter sp. YH12136]
MRNQVGFTLIELMIALMLGLIISAAAMLLFFTASRSQTLQQGQSGLQDDANFGLNAIVKDIRLGNLNAVQASINDYSAFAGIVFRSSENAIEVSSVNRSNLPLTIEGDTADINLLSRSHGHTVGAKPQWTGDSNVNNILSDQLTIQYLPQYIKDNDGDWYGGFDCEGNPLKFTEAEGRQYVVQRYFLREDDNKSDNEPNKPLALACDSGHYAVKDDAIGIGDPDSIQDFGDAGQIILKRADYFRVLYSIQNGANHRYVDAKTYLDLAAPRPRILAVQLGILGRSNQSVGNDSTFKDDQVFQVLDQAVTIKMPASNLPKYARQVVTQTVALRNTFGERGL